MSLKATVATAGMMLELSGLAASISLFTGLVLYISYGVAKESILLLWCHFSSSLKEEERPILKKRKRQKKDVPQKVEEPPLPAVLGEERQSRCVPRFSPKYNHQIQRLSTITEVHEKHRVEQLSTDDLEAEPTRAPYIQKSVYGPQI